MKKIIKYNLIALLAMVFVIYSCDSEDYTDHSNLSPASPTITVGGTGSGYTLTEAKTVYSFDVTLSVAQIADISLYVSQTDGDATNGEDFNIVNSNSRIYIPANTTTGTLVIEILGDEVIEAEETFTLTIGDERTANATITPVTVDFTLVNYTADDLTIEMSWDTDALDAIGLDIEPTEAVDLRMLILDPSDSSIIGTYDGAAFESFNVLSDTLDDGTYLLDGDYLIATDVYATVDAGDYNSALTVDVVLDFYQGGVIANDVLAFDGAFTNEFVCPGYRIYLANFSKVGTTYTFDENAYSIPSSPVTGTWYGTDGEYRDYESEIVSFIACEGLQISGFAFGLLQDPGWWGEPIVAGGAIPFDVNLVAGTIDIPFQYYCTTTYGGSLYDYQIEGWGTIDMSGEYPTAIINYYIYQDGWDFSDYLYSNGVMTYPYFVATLTMDPAGLPVKKSSSNIELEKPIR
jgi:hypothetical protein